MLFVCYMYCSELHKDNYRARIIVLKGAVEVLYQSHSFYRLKNPSGLELLRDLPKEQRYIS